MILESIFSTNDKQYWCSLKGKSEIQDDSRVCGLHGGVSSNAILCRVEA
jgi:hypothetical protein